MCHYIVNQGVSKKEVDSFLTANVQYFVHMGYHPTLKSIFIFTTFLRRQNDLTCKSWVRFFFELQTWRFGSIYETHLQKTPTHTVPKGHCKTITMMLLQWPDWLWMKNVRSDYQSSMEINPPSDWVIVLVSRTNKQIKRSQLHQSIHLFSKLFIPGQRHAVGERQEYTMERLHIHSSAHTSFTHTFIPTSHFWNLQLAYCMSLDIEEARVPSRNPHRHEMNIKALFGMQTLYLLAVIFTTPPCCPFNLKNISGRRCWILTMKTWCQLPFVPVCVSVSVIEVDGANLTHQGIWWL